MMVYTSSKSFQSMLLYFLSFTLSLLPLLFSCFNKQYQYTYLHLFKITSLFFVNQCNFFFSSSPISKMYVQAATIFVKYSQFSEDDLRNSNCGLFFYRQLSAIKKFLPWIATYWAVCWIMAMSALVNFSGTSALYLSGSGSLTSSKTFSKNSACSLFSSISIYFQIFATCSLTCYTSCLLASSALTIIFLLYSATIWSQKARQGLSLLRNANSGLFSYISMSAFSNYSPFFATQQAVLSTVCLIAPGGTIIPFISYILFIIYPALYFAIIIYSLSTSLWFMDQQPTIANNFLTIFEGLPSAMGEKYAQRIATYHKKVIPFQISRINENKNLSSKNSSLERHKLDLMQKISHLTEKGHKQEQRMERQAQKIIDLSRTVAELDRANNDSLSVIEVFKITMKELEGDLNENIEIVKKVQSEKKQILDDYEVIKNEYNILLENYMKDKNLIAEKLNYLNELEQSLIEKEKQLKEQDSYLKKQWEEFENEKKQLKQRPKIFKKPVETVPTATNIKIEQKEQKETIIDQILRNPIKKIIKHHNSQIYDGCFSEDCSLFMSCGGDRVIKIYDMVNYQPMNVIQGLEDSTFLCLSSEGGEGKRLLAGSTDKSVQLYEIGTGKELHRFVDHAMKVNSVSWLSSKDTVVSGSEDKYIKLWSLEKLSNITSISCGKPVKCLTSKINQSLIYSGHSDGSVRVYSLNQPAPISQIKGIIDRAINSICLLDNPQHLLVSSQQGSPIHLFDLKMNKSIKKYEGQDYCNTAGRALASRSEKYIIAGNCDGYIYYWNKEKGSFEKKVSGHDYGINVLRYGKNGKLVSCDSQGNVIVWYNN